MLRMPIVLASLAGLGVNLGGVPLPGWLLEALDMLGSASIPLMLFALGVRMLDVDFSDWRTGALGAVAWPLSAWLDLQGCRRPPCGCSGVAAGGAQLSAGRAVSPAAAAGGLAGADRQSRQSDRHAGGTGIYFLYGTRLKEPIGGHLFRRLTIAMSGLFLNRDTP